MSNPQQDEPLESDAVFGGGSPPLNDETLIQPEPLPKSDPETLPPAAPVPDPDEISPGEEEDDDEDGEEIDEETPVVSSAMNLHTEPPTADPNVSTPDVTLASPTNRRGGFRRKKSFKGKGKGKSNAKKLQAIEENLKTLRLNLNPIRFIPLKLLDFRQHEKLLRKLGLWDFVQIDFDRTIRADFIAQLVANYNSKNRASYVNGCRVMVNRADLARALKLPLKKEKVNAAGAEVDLESEVFSEDSIGFVIGFMSDWVLLHEDMWWMPKEVSDWMKLIKEGHPEKVDWAGLIWFMVEKEVKQGEKLRDCYYASHLQHLIKCQREDLFLIEEPVNDEVEIVKKDMEDGYNEEKAKESDAVEMTVEEREENSVVEGPSTELTLGQDSEKEEGGKEGVKEEGVNEGVKEEGVKEEGVKDFEMVDAEKCGDSDEEGGEEEQEHENEHEHEQEQWLFNGKNKMGEHFMQPCSAENDHEFVGFEDKKDQEEEMDEEENGEEDEEVERNDYNVFPNDDGLEGDGFTGNFLQGMEGNQMAFTSDEHIHNQSSVDHARADVQQHIEPQPSFFNNSGKRVIDYDYDTVNDPNKRLRINETWDNKHADFGMLMEQMEQIGHRARFLYEEKEQAMEQSSMNQQILINELQKRDAMIEHLHKARLEEAQKKDFTISRLERELFLMGSVLDGYKKAFKENKKAFAEYRERAKLPEESLYKDAGPGGLMLTAAEIERRRVMKTHSWVRASDSDFTGPLPQPRSGHTAVNIGKSKIVFFGGLVDKKFLNDIIVYDTGSVSDGNVGPSPRAFHIAVSIDCHMFIFGGRSGGKRLGDFWVLDTDIWQWSELTTFGDLPSSRDFAAASAVGNSKIVMFGGWDGKKWLSDVFVLDTISLEWMELSVSGTIPPPRCGHSVTMIEKRLLIYGGRGGGGPIMGDLWALKGLIKEENEPPRWTQLKLPGQAPSPRCGHTLASGGPYLMLFGGHETGGWLSRYDIYYNDCVVLDRVSVQWKRLPTGNEPPPARAYHSMNCVGSRCLLFGGFDGKSTYGDLWWLVPEDDPIAKRSVMSSPEVVSESETTMGEKDDQREGDSITELQRRLGITGLLSNSMQIVDELDDKELVLQALRVGGKEAVTYMQAVQALRDHWMQSTPKTITMTEISPLLHDYQRLITRHHIGKGGSNLELVGLGRGTSYHFYHVKNTSQLRLNDIPSLLAEYKELLSSRTEEQLS